MNWQDFDYRGRGRQGKYVSVSGGKVITIMKALVDRHKLGKYPFVKLRFDKQAKKLGLKFLVEREPKSATIHQKSAFVIAASVFIRDLGIANGRYEAEWDETEKMLVCSYAEIAKESAA